MPLHIFVWVSRPIPQDFLCTPFELWIYQWWITSKMLWLHGCEYFTDQGHFFSYTLSIGEASLYGSTKIVVKETPGRGSRLILLILNISKKNIKNYCHSKIIFVSHISYIVIRRIIIKVKIKLKVQLYSQLKIQL